MKKILTMLSASLWGAMAFLAGCSSEDRPVAVTDVVISPSSLSIAVGDSSELSVTVLPEDASDKAVRWSSENPKVATVSTTGKVKAVGIGETVIAAYSESSLAISAKCQITVTPIPISELKLNTEAQTITRGNEAQLECTVLPEEAAQYYTVLWSSNNEAVATVDQTGHIISVAPGEAVITAEAGGKSVSCTITVKEVEVTMIYFTVKSATVKVGETYQLKPSIFPAEAASIAVITYQSADPAIAAVSETGLVSGVAPGTVTMTASAGGKSATCEILVPSGDAPLALEFVTIPAGTFVMGSPDAELYHRRNEVLHTVTISKPFQIGKYEVTNYQYAEFLNATEVDGNGLSKAGKDLMVLASSGDSDWGLHYIDNKWVPVEGYDNYPAINVTWTGANAFAAWAGGSLPTEAQWEYACRGGLESMPFNIGDGKNLNGKLANYDARKEVADGVESFDAKREYPNKTTKVGSYPANGYGCYDMLGNVIEWCNDYLDESLSSDPVTDPTGPATGAFKVRRGGNYKTNPRVTRCAYRDGADPTFTESIYGFRIVKAVE